MSAVNAIAEFEVIRGRDRSEPDANLWVEFELAELADRLADDDLTELARYTIAVMGAVLSDCYGVTATTAEVARGAHELLTTGRIDI